MNVLVLEVEQGSVIHTSDNETSALTLFTLVASSAGVALCAASLILLALTAILFAEWRQSYKNQLLIQLMLARFFYTLVRYVCDIRDFFKVNWTVENLVYLDNYFMVYTELVLVAWMFVFSRQMYRSLVHVFNDNKPNILKVSLFTWSVPIAAALLMHVYYLKRYNDFTVFFVYLLVTKWPILVVNAVTLIRVLKSILRRNNTAYNFQIVIMMIILIFVFCFQQLILDVYRMLYIIVFHKIKYASYVLMASHIYILYHCAAANLFWVFGNTNTRKMWKYAIQCKTSIAKTQLGVRISW